MILSAAQTSRAHFGLLKIQFDNVASDIHQPMLESLLTEFSMAICRGAVPFIRPTAPR